LRELFRVCGIYDITEIDPANVDVHWGFGKEAAIETAVKEEEDKETILLTS
jgi:hypothetical protein